jgi:hypothetical protein
MILVSLVGSLYYSYFNAILGSSAVGGEILVAWNSFWVPAI